MATKRWSLPSSVLTSAMSMWKKPIGYVLNFFFAGLSLDIRQLADAVALQTAMQRGSRQMRDARLQRIQAIIERQQSVPAKGDNDRLIFDRENRGFRFFRTGRQIGHGTALAATWLPSSD